ncbi:MAG TPA: hypothetical protein DD473_16720 [Planctomycetaceae bacterium]|nr:hypothetical protein [Planctomycetaceae bacterium]
MQPVNHRFSGLGADLIHTEIYAGDQQKSQDKSGNKMLIVVLYRHDSPLRKAEIRMILEGAISFYAQ